MLKISLGQDLGQGKTQTVTQTPKRRKAGSTERVFMDGYEKELEMWQRKDITTDAELDDALNAFGIAFACHFGKINKNRRLFFQYIRY